MARPAAGSYQPPETFPEFDLSKGIVTDADRGAHSPGQMVNDLNFMLDKPGKAYKRGGTAYVGDSLSGGFAYRVAAANFPALDSSEVIAFGSDRYLYRLTGGGTTWTKIAGATFGADNGYQPRQMPVMVPDPGTTTSGKLVWGIAAGNDKPRYYDGNGANPAAFGAGTNITPDEGGRYGVVHKGRFVLASSTEHESRIWFSPTIDNNITTTDWRVDIDGVPTIPYIDADHKITGTCSLSNVMLILTRSYIERLLGDAPPPGGNMTHGTIGYGPCSDSRSIAIWNDSAIWAGTDGVYMSNGQTVHDLTAEGGVKTLWWQVTDGWDELLSHMAGGVYRNHYFLTVSHPSGDWSSWVLDIPRRVWWQLDMALPPSWYCSDATDASVLYVTNEQDPYVYDFGPFFDPVTASTTDADGSDIAGFLQLRYLTAQQLGRKGWRQGRLNYNLQGTSSTITIETSDTETAFATTTLGTTDLPNRAREEFDISGESRELAIEITQPNECDLCEIYGLEIEYRPMPLSRV